MLEVIDEKVFHLYNETISYVITIMPNGQLGQLYYGAFLGRLTSDDVAYMEEHDNKSAGTVKFSSTSGIFTLADRAQTYPVYGTSDFKEGALDVKAGVVPYYLDFQVADYSVATEKKRDLTTPATYGLPGEVTTLTVTLRDDEHQLELAESFSIFENIGAIVRGQALKNLGAATLTLDKMMSGVLDLPDADYDFINLSGAWLKERQIKRRPLVQGTVSVGSLKGASGHQHNPFVALIGKEATLTSGACYAANLVYSGNFLAQAEVDEWDRTRLMVGLNPSQFAWQLTAGQSFQTPEAVLFYSNQGVNGLMDATHALAQKHIVDRTWQYKDRPIVFNNWEATYFDFDEEKLLTLAKQGQALGMECFVLDDGWFGHRDTDRTSLSDWTVDKKKFPQGMGEFAQKIHAMNLQLGIWFEPEMISPDAPLYAEHPEWVVGHPYARKAIGRGQYVLDFANPEVVANVFAQMRLIIDETQLDYIKWDMNRNITEAYSAYLAAENLPQQEFFHRYILGVYQLYAKLLTAFPNLLIEGCAGGGGRFDLGILFYSPQIWPSDDSDAVERLHLLTGTTLAYPLSAFSNHVSASPNHQTARQTSLKMRQDVCLFGPLGYELDLNLLSAADKEEIRTHIAFYKQHRQLLVYGEFFQLLSMEQSANTVAWGVKNEDASELFLGYFQKLAQPNAASQTFFKVPQVVAEKMYRVNDAWTVSGRVLQTFGLRAPYICNGANMGTADLVGDFQSYIFHLVEVD